MTDVPHIAARLLDAAEGQVLMNQPLGPFTTYQIGGPTAVLVSPGSSKAVGRVLEVVAEEEIPLLVLGGGSNMLVSDDGWSGVTLQLSDNLTGWRFEENEALVMAGSVLMDLIRSAVAAGLAGMELMAGIPGRVGGALRMNAGAFGQEMEACVTEVSGFNCDGKSFRLLRDEIDFGYRKAPELEKCVITSARLRFSYESPDVLDTRMRDILSIRSEKQPVEHPSCGSVFKRPPGHFAGALIEEVGMKGRRVGDAMVSMKHAGFILNTGKARASDVYELIRIIEEAVLERFGIILEREVKIIGFPE